MIGLKYKLIAFSLVGGFVVGCFVIDIKASNKITELRATINQLQKQLKECQASNQDLLNQIQLRQEEYNKALKDLQEASIKPVKRVYIRQVVKEPVYISNQECQQLADLIKQAEEQMQK